MKVVAFKFFILVIILSGILTSCSNPARREQEKPSEIVKAQNNELPNMVVHILDGQNVSAKTFLGRKNVLILFQPDCDHCQNEARQIKERISAFKNYDVYFITASQVEETRKFSTDFKFNIEKNFHFATTDVQSIIDSYGPVQTPSIYIYSEQGKLLNQFNGQTEIDIILKVM